MDSLSQQDNSKEEEEATAFDTFDEIEGDLEYDDTYLESEENSEEEYEDEDDDDNLYYPEAYVFKGSANFVNTLSVVEECENESRSSLNPS